MTFKRKMTHIGIGPWYVAVVVALYFGAIYVVHSNNLSKGEFESIKLLMSIFGILFIVLGSVIWWKAAYTAKINKNISANKLVTTGIYAWVRNPIYSGIATVFTGILIIENNLFLLVLPPFYFLLLKVMSKKEELVLEKVFGGEYLKYKSKVNCCIPWIPNRRKE